MDDATFDSTGAAGLFRIIVAAPLFAGAWAVLALASSEQVSASASASSTVTRGGPGQHSGHLHTAEQKRILDEFES